MNDYMHIETDTHIHIHVLYIHAYTDACIPDCIHIYTINRYIQIKHAAIYTYEHT